MADYLLWFLVGVGFLLAEMLLPGFIVIFFCLGSWVAALSCVFTSNLSIQIGVFIVASLVTLFTLRRIFLRTFAGQTKGGVDEELASSKIGKTAEVTKAISPHKEGEIKCMGSFWRAVSDKEIGVGRAVTITSTATGDGMTFNVQPVGGGDNE